MNQTEALDALAAAARVDGRTVTLSTAQAWADALPGVTLDAALHAITEHQRTSTEPVQPAHILAIVRRMRTVAVAATAPQQRARPATPDPDAIRAHVNQLRALVRPTRGGTA